MGVIDIHASRLSVGTEVSLITGAQNRYQGVVAVINSIEGTLTLQNVCFCGTENRLPTNVSQNTDNKTAPEAGSVFDLITFWTCSIIQLSVLNEGKQDRNALGDQGIAKAGVEVDGSRGRPRRDRSWWSNFNDQQRPVRSSPTDGLNGVTAPVSRYISPSAQNMLTAQPRMLVSYPRRGRSMGMIHRQPNYVPVVPFMSGSNAVSRRNNYVLGFRGGPMRLLNAPVPPQVSGPRGNGRRSMPMAHRFVNQSDDRRYPQGNVNPNSGVFVYLPPDMAAAYQSRGINLIPERSNGIKRRGPEHRGVSRRPNSVEPGIDCSKPYDFETANADFAAIIAELERNVGSLSTGNPTANVSTSTVTNSASSTGDGLNSSNRTTGNSVSGVVTAASGNGASGDSSLGVVTSTVTVAATENTTGGSTSSNADSSEPLAKGEYYVREKCFFDQISRSEGGPRGPFMGSNNRGNYNQSRFAQQFGGGLQINSQGYGGSSSIAAAKRERQLNLETFGTMAVRTTFTSRRRSARDLVVSTPA